MKIYRVMSVFSAFTAVLMVLAIFRQPYIYFQFLRAFTFGISFYSIAFLSSPEVRHFRVLLIIAAVIFNPFLPVHMTKTLWLVPNLLGMTLYGTVALRTWKMSWVQGS